MLQRDGSLGQSSKNQHLEKARELSDRSGSSGYPSLGDTGAAVLQRRDELCSAATEEQL